MMSSETMTFNISDASGSGNQEVTIGNWYHFENITVRTFSNSKILITTPQIKMSPSPSGQTHKITPTDEDTITSQIERVNIQKTFTCNNCRIQFPNFNPDSFSIKCTKCGDRVQTTFQILKTKF